MKRLAMIFLFAAILLVPELVAADWLSKQAGPITVCFGFNYTGKPFTAEEHSFAAPIALTFPANLGAIGSFASGCKFKTAATADAAFLLQDSSTTKATITVGAGATTCTFSSQAAFTIAQGHRVGMVAPTQDATLADGSVTLCVTRP